MSSEISKSLMIQVISLPDDVNRRAKLQKLFEQDYAAFEFLDATDFRHHVPPDVVETANEAGMTPSELGCTHSHVRALERFMVGNERHCLILEDDVEGVTHAFEGARSIAQKVSGKAFVLCGGQQGLRNRQYIYGTPPDEDGMSRLDARSLMFASRACAYLVTRQMAQHLLNCHRARCVRADDWGYLLDGIGEVYYANLFMHPVDLDSSHLERQRSTSRGGFWKKLLDDGVFATLVRNFRKIFLKLTAHARGMVQMKAD